ncbi:MAG: hypothetical protein NC517_00370 [Firmicutes bacterium]|nr:hypothetical protein [Bacillota bacterium]
MTVYKRRLSFCLMALCAAAALKILFMGYDIDEQYAVSMAYRLLKGDRLLTDLWEPHQTSGWLCMLFMAPYMAIFHTTTGIFLYLRVCGLILHSIVGVCLYRTLKGYLERENALLVCCIYFFTLPKLMFLPEFSNIQVWCLLSAVLCLLRYYGPSAVQPGTYRLRYLILAGCFFALEVFSYPSTVFAFAVCVICMVRFRRSGRLLIRELLCLLVPCLLGALIFLAVLLSYIPLGELWNYISIVASDGSHSAPWGERLLEHGRSLEQILLFFLVYALLAFALQFLYCRKAKRSFSLLLWCELLIICTLVGQIFIWLFGGKYPNYPMVEYFFLPVLLLCAVFKRKFRMSPALGFFVLTPLAAFAGILLFSNHPLLVSLPFLGPCVTGILALPQLHEVLTEKSTGRLRRTSRGALVLWVCVLLFGRLLMQRTTGGRHDTVFDDVSLLRRGPAIGLIADTPCAVRYRDNYELITGLPLEGANVFYMGVNTDLYLVEDLGYATPSTICSPTFDDKTDIWFRLHPDRQPDYVVCDTDLLDANLWVITYVQENCQPLPVAENDYIVVYRTNRDG